MSAFGCFYLYTKVVDILGDFCFMNFLIYVYDELCYEVNAGLSEPQPAETRSHPFCYKLTVTR